ncbi:hypothetical protein SDRG_09100 [Saprolegnia diclina VS20]|uniref:EF-hand domain-containing protein n=1 Tax=Saprolegnia diclina (strain VS20) TaxID=1156394 RepID=T0RSH2_SAPDV|nr:hypothetical protein SDRG_09100 [Saprolegnia diclina VS20]EQC33112.1 hypothetical protein SDRG_09100 [Saprolegnia diclina VS20]|eukprot:XP_008613235.1 hypothetical protein SDRG_09100 [Saprolegnia diclina VS20]
MDEDVVKVIKASDDEGPRKKAPSEEAPKATAPEARRKSMIPKRGPPGATASPSTSGKEDGPKPWKKPPTKGAATSSATISGKEDGPKPWKKKAAAEAPVLSEADDVVVVSKKPAAKAATTETPAASGKEDDPKPWKKKPTGAPADAEADDVVVMAKKPATKAATTESPVASGKDDGAKPWKKPGAKAATTDASPMSETDDVVQVAKKPNAKPATTDSPATSGKEDGKQPSKKPPAKKLASEPPTANADAPNDQSSASKTTRADIGDVSVLEPKKKPPASETQATVESSVVAPETKLPKEGAQTTEVSTVVASARTKSARSINENSKSKASTGDSAALVQGSIPPSTSHPEAASTAAPTSPEPGADVKDTTAPTTTPVTTAMAAPASPKKSPSRKKKMAASPAKSKASPSKKQAEPTREDAPKRRPPRKAAPRPPPSNGSSTDDGDGQLRQPIPKPFRVPRAKRKSGSELWLEREKAFEHFRSGNIVMPVPEGPLAPTRVSKTSAYCIDLHLVKNWPLTEKLEQARLEYGLQVTFFHAVTRRFFGNTWRSPEMPAHAVADVHFQMSVCFLTDVVDPNCVAIVELIAHEKSTSSASLTATSHGCGWCILPLFGQKMLPATTEAQSVNVFMGSPRYLWVVAQAEWQGQPKVPGGKLLYHIRPYDPLLKAYALVRKNEMISGIDRVPGLKDLSLVGILPSKLDLSRVKLPREICTAEEFAVTVATSSVFVHLREDLERNLIARLAKTRRALYPIVESMDGQVTSRVLKVALHNGRCFRTRQHTVALKAENGSNTLSAVQHNVKLKGYTLSSLVAIVLLLQFTVQFRLVWPKNAKPKTEKEPLPTEDVVVVTMGARAIVPSDGKKFYYHDKSTPTLQESTNQADDAMLHIELRSGTYARPYSDNVLYTSPAWTNSVKEGKLEETFASVDVEVLVEGASLSSSDEEANEDAENEVEKPDTWADDLRDKAARDATLSQALQSTMNPTPKTARPQYDQHVGVEPHLTTIVSDDVAPAHELSRASKALLTRHGMYDDRAPNSLHATPVRSPKLTTSIADELADNLNLLEIQFQFAAFRPAADRTVPMSVHFVFQFYTFEPTKTDRLVLTATHSAATYLLCRQDGAKTKPAQALAFEVHTTRHSMLEPRAFAEYLQRKSLLVDVYDGDSLLPLGAIAIPLHTLLRQGQKVKKHHAEYPVQTLPTDECVVKATIGSVQVLMSNFASASAPCPRNLVAPNAAESDVNWRLSAGAPRDNVPGEPRHRVRARPLADSNQELRDLLIKEQFYAPTGSHTASSSRRPATTSDGASLTRDELDLLCTRFATQATRTNRLDANALLALISLQPSIKPHSNATRRADTQQFLDQLRAVFLQAHAQGLRFKSMFEFLDANGDGFVTPAEFVKGLRQLGPLFASLQPAAVEACVAYFDTNGDGLVNYKEFLAFVHQACCIDLRDELRQVLLRGLEKGLDVPSIFRHLDTSGDGTLSYVEFETALAQLSFQVSDRAMFESFCKQLDADSDGSISYMEFITSMGLVLQAQDALVSILQQILQRTVAKDIDIGDLFHHVDTDGSGAVSYDELRALIQEMDVETQLSDALLQELIERIDKDKSGSIDVAEFMAFVGLAYDPATTVQRRLERILTKAAAAGVSVADAFRQFDNDHSGSVTPKEFQAALASLQCPISDGDLKRVMRKLDGDGDGSVSYKELLFFCFGDQSAAIVASPIETQLKVLFDAAAAKGMDLLQCFAHFDKDGSNQVSASEFTSALRELGFGGLDDDVIAAIVTHLDKDGDGQIALDEFVALATPRTQQTMRDNNRPYMRLKTMLTKAMASGIDVCGAFAHFDTAHTGAVSYGDFETALRQLGGAHTWSAVDMQDILSHLDTDKSQTISLDEFGAFLGIAKSVSLEMRFRALLAKATGEGVPLEQSFAHFDTARHGFLTPAGFHDGLVRLNFNDASSDEAGRLFAVLNASQTGEVTLAEFKAFVGGASDAGHAVIPLPPMEKLRELFGRASAKGVNVQHAFAHFDKDGNGSISHAEFDQAIAELGFTSLSAVDVASIRATLDKDNSGSISLAEFKAVYPPDATTSGVAQPPTTSLSPLDALQALLRKAQAQGVDIAASFAHFDKDGNGQISHAEFDSAMTELGFITFTASDLAAIRSHLDKDGSGSISIAEFKSLYDTATNTETSSPLAKLQTLLRRAQAQGVDAATSFAHFDKDGDGGITYAEFAPALRELGFTDLTASDMDELQKALDKDGSGVITLAEFSKLYAPTPLDNLKALLARASDQGIPMDEAFAHFDADGDGVLTSEEFAAGLQSLGLGPLSDGDIKGILLVLDKDGSGKIALSEFRALYPAKTSARKPLSKPSSARRVTATTELAALLQPVQTKAIEALRKVNAESVPQAAFEAALLSLGVDGVTAELVSAAGALLGPSGVVALADFGALLGLDDGSKTSARADASLPATLNSSVAKFRRGIEAATARGVDIRRVLTALDVDNSGSLAYAELDTGLLELEINDMTNDDVMALRATLDPSQSGRIALAVLWSSEATVQQQAPATTARASSRPSALGKLQQLLTAAKQGDGKVDSVFQQFTVIDGCIALGDFELGLVELGFNDFDDAEMTQIRTELGRDGVVSLQRLTELSDPTPTADAKPAVAAPTAARPIDAIKQLLMQAKESGVNIDNAFAAYDKEGSGAISRADFDAGLQALALADLAPDDALLLGNHLELDGIISLVELKKLYTKPRLAKAPSTGDAKRKPWQKPPPKTAATASGGSEAAPVSTDAPDAKPSRTPATSARTLKTKASAREMTVKGTPPAVAALSGLLLRAQGEGIDVSQAFSHFDKDGNGKITHTEFDQGMAALGMDKQLSPVDIVAIRTWLDADGSGAIALSEFQALYTATAEQAKPTARSEVVSPTTAKPDGAQRSQTIPRLNLAKAKPALEKQTSDPVLATAKKGTPASISSSATRPALQPKPAATPASVPSQPKRTQCVDATPTPGRTPTPESSAKPVTTAKSALKQPPAAAKSHSNNELPHPTAQPTTSVEYRFSPEPNVRLVEMKLRKAAIAAAARGVRAPALLTKYAEGKSDEILRVRFVEFLMELGLSLVDDLGSAGYVADAPSLMHDKVYARQLERLRMYKRQQQRTTTRAQRDLVDAASLANHGRQNDVASGRATVDAYLAQKHKMLQIVQFYRDGHKKALIQALLKDHVTTTVHLYAMFGSMLFFELPVRNPYGHAERFRIEWADAELQLVTDAAEWAYYRDHVPRAVDIPNAPTTRVERDMVDSLHELLLDGGDYVALPFRFLSLALRTHERTIPISIKSVAHGHTIAVIQLHVHPAPFVVHRTYRFQHFSLAILRRCLKWVPPPSNDENDNNQAESGVEKFVMCPDANVIVETRPVERPYAPQEIYIKYRVGDYPSLGVFYLLLYDDMYHARLHEIWRIHIQSMMRLDLHATMGQGVQNELIVKGDAMPRRVSCFSSHPTELQFKPSGIFQLIPHAFNRIEVRFATMQVCAKQIVVHVVDVDSRDLVGAWLLNTTVSEPIVTKVFDVTLPTGVPVLKKISYRNPWDEDRSFVLRSNDPSIMKPREPRLQLQGNGDGYLRLAFAPHSLPCSKKVYLFINDHQDQNEECLLFHLTWSDSVSSTM